MAVKERSQIKGTDAQIKAFAGHNGVLAFATDTKSLHVLSGTAGTTTEFLPSTKVATKTEVTAALDGKLSTSGGTVNGSITVDGGNYSGLVRGAGVQDFEIIGANNDGCFNFFPGESGSFSAKKSASLFLASTGYTGSTIGIGQFMLSAMNATTGAKSLAGYPDGSLTWCGHNVISVVAESYGGSSWYRKYSDGWIEQGGNASFPAEGFLDVTFPIAFNNNPYTITFCSNSDTPTWLANYTPTTFTLARGNNPSIAVWWYACGK